MQEFEKHPQLASYITEMKETGQIPTDFDKFLSCLNDSLNPSSAKSKLSIDQRKLNFASTLSAHVNVYGREMILEFYEYWTENLVSGKKFRQENEKAWDLKRRLKTWAARNKLTRSSIIEKEKPVIGRQDINTVTNSLKNFG